MTLSVEETRASVRYWSGDAKSPTLVREFPWRPATWQRVRIRVRTSERNDGEVRASVDGDEFQGVQDVAVHRPEGRDYRPKWGLYRGVRPELSLADAYVEHKDVSAEASEVPESPDPAVLRIAARRPDGEKPAGALASLQALPTSDAKLVAMLGVFNRWTDEDPDAVLAWAGAQPPTTELDAMLWYFATDSTLRYTRRDIALSGAALIAAPSLRAGAIEHVVLIWARTEPEAAARYVVACPALSAEAKARIAEKIRKLKMRDSEQR